jgi:chromate reductase
LRSPGETLALRNGKKDGKMTKLLGLCGSLRAESLNRKLLRESARIFAPDQFDEADLRLPLYDGDLEETAVIPPQVQRLADQIKAADAVVIASPEYNKALSGVLKNALDWVSRTKGGPWRDKPVAIVSASDGRAGGDRGQFSLRLCLVPFRANVLPGPEVMVAFASKEFDAHGSLTSESYIRALTELMTSLKSMAQK